MTEPPRRVFRPMIGAFTLVAIGAGVFMARFPARDARSGRLYDLRNGSTEVRQRAAEELGTGNDDDAAPIFSALIGALGDDDAGVRARACAFAREEPRPPSEGRAGPARPARRWYDPSAIGTARSGARRRSPWP